MKKALKLLSLLFLALSLTIILADGSFISNSNSIVLCNDYHDMSNHCEKSHSHGSEDNIFLYDFKIKTIYFLCKKDFIPTEIVDFKNCFINNIWKPPKFS